MNQNSSRSNKTGGILRRLLSAALAVCMVISMTPAAVAEDIADVTTAPVVATAPEVTAPAEPVTQETQPTEPAPEVTTPAEPAPEVTTPAEPVPEVTTPAETDPETTTPAETIPEETAPAETDPEETTPADSDPAPEETDSESPQVQLIRELIGALPFEVTEDNAEEVRARLEEILDLYSQLEAAEQELVDIAPCYLLQMQLDEIDSAELLAEVTGGATEAEAVAVSADNTVWNGGYFIVNQDVTLTDRVKAMGDVTLILGTGYKLTAPKGITVANSDRLTIKGDGELEAIGSEQDAGIGGQAGKYWCTGGTITIEGGTITATGGQYAAGIGGGADADAGGSGGAITIKGGTVNATGGNNAAGIGGGAYTSTYNGTTGGSGGTITISGGTVNATGGMYGAGIGGGNKGSGGTIAISGGTVVTTGGSMGAAGIGGGNKGSGGNITISGGNVTATGSTNAICDGIGNGKDGSGGTFSTGNSGSALIVATGGSSSSGQGAGIGDTSNQSSWSGIIFQNGDCTVGGTQTLTQSLTLESGKTLTINEGASLIVPAGVTLTNNGTITNSGTLAIAYGGAIEGTGTIGGSETAVFTTGNLTDDMFSVPDNTITYDGENKSQAIEDAITYNPASICGQDFAFDSTGWNISITIPSGSGDMTYNVEFWRDNVHSGIKQVNLLPAPLTVTTATIEEKSYDGTTDAIVTAVTFTGLVEGETLVLGTDYTATAVYDDANAGTDKTVTVTVTLADTVEKYCLAEGTTTTATGTITARELTKDQITVTLPQESYTWAGEPINPIPESVSWTDADGISHIIPTSEYTVTYDCCGENGHIVPDIRPRVYINDVASGNYVIPYISHNFTIICNHEYGFSNGECNVCSTSAAVEVTFDGENPQYFFSTDAEPINTAKLNEILNDANIKSAETGTPVTVKLYPGWTIPEFSLSVNGKMNFVVDEDAEFASNSNRIVLGQNAELTLDAAVGMFSEAYINNSAKLTMNNGYIGYVTVNNTGEFIMNGGTVGNDIAAHVSETARVTITGGEVKGTLYSYPNTNITITGGNIAALKYVDNNGAAIANQNITGGSFGTITVPNGMTVSQLLSSEYAFYNQADNTVADASGTTLSNVFVAKAGAKIVVNLDFKNEEIPATGEGYRWDIIKNNAGDYERCDLYLDNCTVLGDIIVPDKVPVTITLTGDSTVGGNVTAGSVDGYNNPYDITITGTGTLDVGGKLGGSSADGSTLTIDTGATVNVKNRVESGGTVIVKGSLTATGGKEFVEAVYTGKLRIEGGKLTVSGRGGAFIQGINTGYGKDFSQAFVITEGGNFTANCTDYNIMVYEYSSALTVESASTIVSIPTGYIANGYGVRAVKDSGNSFYLSVVALDIPDSSILSGTGMGGYISIKQQPNYAATVDPKEYDYTGSEIIPNVTVTLDGAPYTGEYTLICENNINPGNATVTVKGTDPDLNLTLEFTINCTHPTCDNAGKCTVCNEQFPFAVKMGSSQPLKPFNDFAAAWAEATKNNGGVYAYLYIYSPVDYTGTLTIPASSHIVLTMSDGVTLNCQTIVVEIRASLNLSSGTVNGDIVLNEETDEYLGGGLTLNGTINRLTIKDGAEISLKGGKILGGITVEGGKKVNDLLMKSSAGLKKANGTWLTVEERNVAAIDYAVDVVTKPFVLIANPSKLNLTLVQNSKGVEDLQVDVGSSEQPKTVEWYKIPKNGTATLIPDATAVEGFIPDVSALGTTQYYCVATSGDYTDISPIFTVEVIECPHEQVDETGRCPVCDITFAVCVICMNDNPEQPSEDKYFETIEAAFDYVANLPSGSEMVHIEVLKDLTVENTLTVPAGKTISLYGMIKQENPPTDETPEGPAEVFRTAVITGPEQGAAIVVDGSLVVNDVIINSNSNCAIQVMSDHEAALGISSSEIDGLDVTGTGGITLYDYDTVIKNHITLPEGRALSELFTEGNRYNSTLKVISESGDSFKWLYTEDLDKNTVSGDMITIALKPIRFVGDWFNCDYQYEKDSAAEAIEIPYIKESTQAAAIEWFKVTENGTEVITDTDGTVVNDTETGISKFTPNTSATGASKYICRVTCDGYTITTPEIRVSVCEMFAITATSMLDNNEGTTVANIRISDINGNAPSDGKFKQGETVRVIVEDRVTSCRFLGWYDGDTLLSSERDLEFTVEKNLNLVAKFESYGTATITFECVNGAQIKYGETVIEGTKTETIPIGVMLDLSADNPDMVSAWLNGSDKIIGTGESVKLTVTGSMTIKLVYNLPNDSTTQSAMVEYVSDYGQLLLYKAYSADEAKAITPPVAPSKLGYTFTKWSHTPDDISKAIADGAKHITVKPVYDKDTNANCTVTVKYIGINKTDDTHTGTKGDGLTVSAYIGDESKTFTHWSSDSDGKNVLSYQSEYLIRLTSDITLYANYSDAKPTEIKPVIAITAKYASTVNGKNKVSFAATRSVPEGYIVVEHGILFGIDSSLYQTDALVLNGENVRVSKSGDMSNNSVFTVNITVGSKASTTVYARGYMIIRNDYTGDMETIYSDIDSGSFDGLNTK